MLIQVNYRVEIVRPTLRSVLQAFIRSLLPLLQEVVTQTVLLFGQKYMEDGTLRRWYGKCSWKSSSGNRTTYFNCQWGRVDIPQLQIRLANGQKVYITRRILGMERRKHMPQFAARVLAKISALATYRSAATVSELLTGFKANLMLFQRSVCRVGDRMMPVVHPTEQPIFETDGTGVPVRNSTKRGEELKVLAQRKHGGGITIAGINVGRYCEGWAKLLQPIKKVFSRAMLVSDGDYDIGTAATQHGLHHQSCTWHAIHSMKYCLWRDGHGKRSKVTASAIRSMFRLIKSRHFKTDKQFQISVKRVVTNLKRKKLYFSAQYLHRIGENLNTAAQIGIYNSTTSLTERIMNTLNKRINVGTWSRHGVQSIARIRAAIYYNGWRP